ncbi:YdiK family protein [Bacillus sp. SL00103]
MRNPVVWGIIYFAVGVAFTYMAIQNPGDMWSFYSILLMVFAAYNINIALKNVLALSVKLKNSKAK